MSILPLARKPSQRHITIARRVVTFTETPEQPPEWWAACAVQLSMDARPCPKCHSGTFAEYQPPRDRLGECAVILKCLLCGWERVHLAGRHKRPYLNA